MSWNPFNIEDLSIEPSEGHINLTWTCPRCDHTQISEISTYDLVNGMEVECENIKVCGKREAYFSLKLDLEYGSYKGLLDRPLEVETAA